MTPELCDALCCGAVTGGVKFCTLGAETCSFATHTKKVGVVPDHIYISKGCQSAFAHHHAPIAVLSHDELSALLEEWHLQSESVQLLHAVNQHIALTQTSMEGENVGQLSTFQESVLAVATPARKRKDRYEEQSEVPGLTLRFGEQKLSPAVRSSSPRSMN
jgi:hypothetical protein